MKHTRTRLGSWQVERTLGRDLSGAYFAGRSDDGRARATLYLPHDGIVRRRHLLTRLLDAHRGLARAELVRLSALDYDDELPFLIGEPVDDSLIALRAAARPSAAQATQIALAVSDALIAAHDAGVFHAGLDLDNVLWAPTSTPRVLGTGAAVIDIVDPDLLARGDVVALGRLLCTLVASQRAHGTDDDGDPLRDVAHQLADPSTGLTMRAAHALIATCGRGPRARGSDVHRPRSITAPLPADTDHASDHAEAPTVDFAATPVAPLAVGDELRRLGRYRILSRLGRGGMGEVLLAEDPALRRGVAIKRIRPDLEHDPTFRVRLRREAQLAARLCHRAIVQVFDLITSDGVDHVVMEYVPGPSLHTLLAGAPMAVGEVLQIAIELADGLAYAHQHQVLHRDLKLENVLLGTDGQPKIADFGIARRLAGDGRESITGQGAVVGTLRAMSPEQLLGQDADARSDLFSFGVLLYELCTGTSPFAAATDVETIHRVVYHKQSPVHDLVASVPRALSELVDQLLDKSPSARPSSARVVGERLRTSVGAALEPIALADTPARAYASAGISVTRAATGSGAWPPHPPTPQPTPQPTLRRPLVSRIQAPFVLAEIRALQGSIFRRAPEVQNALAVASRLETTYDLRRADLFLPASDTFCAVLEPFSTTTVLTGTLRRIGYEIFPQYMSILGVPTRGIKEALRLQSRSDLVRLICDAYTKCVIGSDSGALVPRITGTIATITDTTFMPCQLQIGVFLGAGKLTGLFTDTMLTEKRCRLRGDTACVYEIAL